MPTKKTATARDPSVSAVERVWRRTGLKPGTISIYRRWVEQLREDCCARDVSLDSQLTLASVQRFARRYAKARGIDECGVLKAVRRAVRAWSWGLAALGVDVLPWEPPRPTTRPSHSLIREFLDFRRTHRGIAASTSRHEAKQIEEFLSFLRSRRRRAARIRIRDVDEFLVERRKTVSRRTSASICSVLRHFLRFLHVTGRLRHDLSSSVASPVQRRNDRPPRSLPWADVCRILKAVDRSIPSGRRDYAILLLMSSYGMGAGEILGLRLEHIDWERRIINVRRPKTGVATLLPLSPEVARALAAYLRHGRPGHAESRLLFVRMKAPHRPFKGSSAIRYVVHKHAAAAGVKAPFLGSHVFRHSFAGRQIDLGAPPKVLSDILGHRRPESTSTYVRIALKRLVQVSLPLPK